MWFEPSDLDESGSRFTSAVEFVVPCPEDPEIDEFVETEASAAQEDLDVGTLRTFETSMGRGASGPALGIALEGLVYVGGAYAGLQVIYRAWQVIRRRFDTTLLSQGAMKALVLYDLLAKRPALDAEDVVVAAQSEVIGPLGPHELCHTGIDPTVLILCTQANTESWYYLVDPRGKVLHCSQGGPLGSEFLFYNTGMLPDWDGESPTGRMLGDQEEHPDTRDI